MLLSVVAPISLLLVTPHTTQVSECLTQYFYGTHGQQNVFITDDYVCVSDAAAQLSSGTAVQLTEGIQQLVWLQQQAVEPSIRPAAFQDEFDAFFSRLSVPAAASTDGEQTVFSKQNAAKLILRNPTSALISVDPNTALTLDLRLPRFWKASPLPPAPVPLIPVPTKAIERVKEILHGLKFDPVVASIVSNISVPQLRADVRYLTGESPQSKIISRHSFSKGALMAADWLKANFEAHGATCMLKPFMGGFAPNVVWCVSLFSHANAHPLTGVWSGMPHSSYEGSENTTETVLLSAHYDSRGSFGSMRAPGADDDGSGTTALLGIARAIARKGVKFRKNVQLVAFAGEEQGLYGSRHYARELHEQGTNLTLMIQADMVGYHAVGEPPQLGLPDMCVSLLCACSWPGAVAECFWFTELARPRLPSSSSTFLPFTALS